MKYIIGISVVIFLFFVVWIIAIFLSLNRYNHIRKDMLAKDFLLKKAVGRSRTWLIAATLWMFTEYAFVIIPFVANAAVIYLSIEPYVCKECVLFLSIVSLSFIIFGYAINPQQHKKCYRKAYAVLDNRINLFLVSSEGTITTDKNSLIEAIQTGENYIDGSYDISK